MSADREDEQIREPVRKMDRDEREMEERLEELEDHIDDAKKAAERRQDHPDPELVAGDWEDASAGAHEGQDPSGAQRDEDEG